MWSNSRWVIIMSVSPLWVTERCSQSFYRFMWDYGTFLGGLQKGTVPQRSLKKEERKWNLVHSHLHFLLIKKSIPWRAYFPARPGRVIQPPGGTGKNKFHTCRIAFHPGLEEKRVTQCRWVLCVECEVHEGLKLQHGEPCKTLTTSHWNVPLVKAAWGAVQVGKHAYQ